MLRAFRWYSLAWVALLWAVSTGAQQSPGAGEAPVPPVIFAAKKVFVSNAGADSGLFPHPFSGSPDRGYNEFYRGVRGMGTIRTSCPAGGS